MDHHSRVEQSARILERRADDQHWIKVARRVDDLIDRPFCRGEQCVLKKQVIDRIGRQAELREHHDCGPDRIARLCQPDRLGAVRRNICDPRERDAAAYAHEVMTVERAKIRHHTYPISRANALMALPPNFPRKYAGAGDQS
jgi:hypothetical protein